MKGGIKIIDVWAWYALGIVCLIAFILVISYYMYSGQWEALGPIFAIVGFFVGFDFAVEYGGINGTEWGYPSSMYHVFGVPIEMIFISMGCGAAIGAFIWEIWPKRGLPVKWGSALLISWSILGFLLYVVDVGVNLIVWVLMPLTIWGTVVIMKHKRGLMPYILIIGLIAMTLDGLFEWYLTIYNSTYFYKGVYDFWNVAPCYFLLVIIGGGIVVSLIVYGEEGDD